MDTTGRTLVCSVLFLDIVEYSRKPVAEQIQLKQAFNRTLGEALEGVAPRDRIILDTGDGAAVTFMGDPEDALFAAMTMRDHQGSVARLGVNLGPVRLVKDLNGQVNIIGDGINVAQRVMSFADPGQLLVSRSFYEVVSCLSRDYANLFHHEGARTDKHVREHDVYAVVGGKPTRTSDTLSGLPADNAATAWLARPAPLGFRRSALVAAPLAFTLIVASGVGARALMEPAVAPAAEVPSKAVVAPKAAAPEAAPKAAPAPRETVTLPSPPRSQVARVERKPADKPRAAAPRGSARLELTVTPWGEILIDGRSRGISPPLRELEIPPGPHTIEIRNSTFQPHLQSVDVKAGETTKIRHRFR
jgi:class 3 adenylate cyclase